MSVCATCSRPLRKAGTTVDDFPGTILHAARGLCWGCYNAEKNGTSGVDRRVVAQPGEEAIVPVRTMLRPSTYRRLMAHAAARDTTVGGLLSLLADASLKPIQGARP